MKIGVVGCGNIGKYIMYSLYNKHYHVIGFDPNVKTFGSTTIYNTLPEKDTESDIDLFIGCVPGSVGFDVLKHMVTLGKPYIDCSFMPMEDIEKAKELKTKSFTLLDMGIAPGISNMLVAGSTGPNTQSVHINVGGIPIFPKWPLYHSATWSVEGLIDEYKRHAKYLSDGKVKEAHPLIETITCNFDGMQLEAFRSDGLRSLIDFGKNHNIKNMNEYTMRWPGHLSFVKALDYMGVLQKALKNMFEKSIKSPDMLLMAVDIFDKQKHTQYTLHHTGEMYHTAMATTTGESAISIVHLIASNKINLDEYDRDTVVFPETLVMDMPHVYDEVLTYLSEEGIEIYREILKLGTQNGN